MSGESCEAAVAAIQFALGLDADECKMFLRYWNEGEFGILREEWEDVPDEVFIGADPLFHKIHGS
ncbi:hypothetical protein ACIPR7_18250 [Pectobacterium parvum]|uniref:Uncharacterized protein n=1 Tax=Pectobacterium odoriferum TaxID=78398 RepID=A0ABR4VK94_9GAMM|nr:MULTISPECIES: hypothetical protein [Pectobacterium]AZK61338.1 hypothetical protein EIP93_02950 [Pectobacterium versatile]KGA39704.1 hypothetical protein KU75_21235 [Pectobacterium odoriferum]MCU1793506.1 hypothetical protein [Pectobacterium polaris]